MDMTVPPPIRHAAGAMLRRLPSRRLLGGTGRLRGRGLVLLWHRVRLHPAGPNHVIPTVTSDLFRRQLEALLELGDVVPLAELDRRDRLAKPRFAITFDDDDPGHVQHALPVLVELGLPATFFLSGRWLHGRGPYWWEVLEAQIEVEGSDGVARRLGIAPTTAEALAGHIEGTAEAARLAAIGNAAAADGLMTGSYLRQLCDADMEIGFHTVDHPLLTGLGEADIADAVRRGRGVLQDAAGATVSRFAYPHGRMDARVRSAVAAAGYSSAWTTSHRPTSGSDDPFARGRWEPGERDPASLIAGVIRRLLMGPSLP
jgi:peptidoglycan/xylan/chitin deacetylase (PgdA/CDA1 family)